MRAWLLLLVICCNGLLANTTNHNLPTDYSQSGKVPFYRCLVSGLIGQAQGSGVPTKRFYQYDKIIDKAAKHYQIDPLFVKAVLLIESGLNPTAVSKSNARGIAQLMHATAKALGITNRYDPNASIWGCAALLKRLCSCFNNDMRLAAAAYNAGPGAIMKLCNCFGSMRSAAAAYDTDSGAVIKDSHISSLRETKPYVKSVVGAWNKMNEYHNRKQE